ncbi:MAG: succinylglutamate desuccinylase/aspartoacylase family protein [Deltaproteobacteria bacterium]|nr:succinylglutamate desuccinylase/aspartoacylase family protein [Deltaproteobacteria bacterium]
MKKNIFIDARDVFEKLIETEDCGIPGTRVFDSGKPGPVLGVAAMIHGNEPCGLAVDELLEKENILTRGKVIFALGNIEAASHYFEENDRNKRLGYRCLKTNLNRVPITFEESDEELKRFRKLIEVFSSCDAVFDFHSTSLPGGRMLIPNDLLNSNLQIGVNYVITRIFPLMKLKTFIEHLCHRNVPGAVIECGVHEEQDTWDFVKYAFFKVLSHLGMANGNHAQIHINAFNEIKPVEIEVFEAVWFPSNTFRMVKNFENFEPVRKGSPLAYDTETGDILQSPEDGFILFPFPVGHEKGTREEACFIGRKKC